MFLLTLIRCSRVDLAWKYFPQAANWLPQDLHPTAQLSTQFDYDSIMIYDSKTGRAPGAEGFPLVTAAGDPIHLGGNPDPEQAGISDLDIERVVELYSTAPVDSHSTPGGSPGKRVTKRWWSVPITDTGAETRVWPIWNDGTTYITFRYEDQNAYNALGNLFTQGRSR